MMPMSPTHTESWKESGAELFRLLVENATDYAIFLLDVEGNIASWNPGARRIKGYRADEIIGRHFSCFYPQEAIDRGWPDHELKVARTEGRFEDEGWRIRKDGTRFWANVVITALKDEQGNLRGFSKITRDLTQRKAAEESALRLVEETTARRVAEENSRLIEEQRERLRVTLESIGDAVISTDAEGRVEILNPVAQELVGWDNAEASGRLLSDVFRVVNEQTRQPVENPALRALAEGIAVGLANHSVLISRDGSERPVDDSAAPIRDAGGHVVGSVLVFRDITERKRAEQALRDSDRRKDEFLATLAHELRNPLAPIRNSLQILKMPRVDAEMAQQTRDVMERQVHHLVRLVDDLLDVSRVMRGKIELRREPIELATVVARAVEIAQPLIEVQGHTLEIVTPAESLLLDADPVRLAQVFGNLLTNAAKYTEANGHLWLTARREGQAAIVSLRDTGIGITPDMLPHVFELFVQADHASTRAQGGLGIGLTLVKNLVEMHGGHVEVHSSGLGRGSEFIVQLPLAVPVAEPVGDANTRQLHPATPASGLRLLVVDDSHDVARSLAMLLRLRGHEVRVAHDGPTALEIAREFHPDVIFLDIGMPRMDGYEVARRIRQSSGLENVVLAALTGWGQPEDRRRTAAAGFNHHLVKPPEPRALERILADVQQFAKRTES
jgi:PAS domain S-box-containing protein